MNTIKNQKDKERCIEISIFQTGEARPKGTCAQLLLVLVTFVACLFVTMALIEDEQYYGRISCVQIF